MAHTKRVVDKSLKCSKCWFETSVKELNYYRKWCVREGKRGFVCPSCGTFVEEYDEDNRRLKK